MKPFRKKRDPIETIILLLGGFLVVMIAFFMARGDLDAYTQLLIQGGKKEEVMQIADTPVNDYNFENDSQEAENAELGQGELIVEEEVEEAIPDETNKAITEVLTTPTLSTPIKTEATPIPPKASPPSTGNYYLQAGAFSDENNANQVVTLLKGMGYGARIEKSSNLFKVRIYGFTTKQEAAEAAQKIKSEGIDAFIGQ